MQVDMKTCGHVFSKSTGDGEARDLTRLDRELGFLIKGLPLSRHGSIFVAQDLKKLHLLKALVVGPADSCYEGGCFEFDIWIPPTFPSVNS